MKKLISFWKQVRERSSDMFTLFRVGIGVKVPTHKLHVKDKTYPLKIEGLQNDTVDPDKFITIDANSIIKYRTGDQVLADIGATDTTLTQEQVEDFVAGVVTAGANMTITYDDAANTLTFVSTDTNTQLTQEQVEDFVAGVAVAGTNVTVTYDDGAGTLTFASTDTDTTYTGSAGIVLSGTDFRLDSAYDAIFNTVEATSFKSRGDVDIHMDANDDETGSRINFKANTSNDLGYIDDKGNFQVDGLITGKTKQAHNCSFTDDLGTTKHYLPLSTTFEQTTIYQDEAAMIMPCDGRIASITIRVSSVTGSGNLTLGVHTRSPGVSQFTAGNWTEEETEVLAVTSTDDYHVFHFAFSNTKHFESTELLSLSIQASSDLGSNTYWYATVVMEYDWNNYLGTTSAEYDSAP